MHFYFANANAVLLSFQVHFHPFIKSKLNCCVSFRGSGWWYQWRLTYTCILIHVSNSYMCAALTTTALSWVPRPALLGCFPQPDAQLPSCPSYCGGLFPCTPSPGPRTRWVAEPHKYFLSHCSHTELNRNLYYFMWVCLCSSMLLSVFTSAVNPERWNSLLF